MARGHIRQRSKKNKDFYTVYVYLGVDPITGRKKYTTEVVRTGKRDAEKRLTELLRLHDAGENIVPSKETTREFLEHWYKTTPRLTLVHEHWRVTGGIWTAT
jgi:hypothetical protein